MIASALILLGLVAEPPKASDYFPMREGTRWTYRESGTTGLRYVDEVETPVTLKGRTVFPITSRQSGDIIGKIYYSIEDDTVAIVAEIDLRQPFEPPRPVFKLGDPTATWDYGAEIPYGPSKAALTVKGTSKLGFTRRVFGEEVPAIEVTTDAVIRPKKGLQIVQHMVAYYAKGYGLVSLVTTSGSGKDQRTSSLDLVKFEPRRTN